MTAIVDAGPLIALADSRDSLHLAAYRALVSEPGALVVPAPVSAEVDYLMGQRLGGEARRGFYRDVAAGRFTVECLERADYEAISDLDRRYSSLELGLADCSIVVLARRFETTRVMTFDTRDFRTVRPLQGGVFTVLPEDENVS